MADLSGDGSGGPAVYGFAVTPNDSTDLAIVPRALWVGGAGNIVMVTAGGDSITLSGITAGTLLPVRAKRILATSTTATLIVGLY